MFVVDSSRSISPAHFETTRNVIQNAIDFFAPTVGGTTQIGVLQYGDAYARK